MMDVFNNIKIRTLALVYMVILVSVLIISKIPIIKKVTMLDFNFWFLIINLILLMWFINKIIKGRVSIKLLINDFKTHVKWTELFKILSLNIVLSIGLTLCILYIAFKINPDFCNKLLNEANKDTNTNFISVIFFAITATLLAPIIEELMFRGIILNRLKSKWGVSIAILLSSIIFGLLHYTIAFLGALFFGIMMSLLYIKTGNILMNIVVHFINNFIMSIGIIIGFFIDTSSTNSSISTSEINYLGIIGLITLIISLFFTIKYSVKNWPRLTSQ